jgi:flagellar hook protein FlgE
MGTAIFAGVSALQSQQRRINVIGNNIANINTMGFRSARVIFQDVLNQTLTSAAPPQAGRGGINPRQVGSGVTIASIDTNFTQGSLFPTSGIADFAIQGDGFFIVNDGRGNLYTRDGSFGLDVDGTVVEPATGMTVQGYTAVDGVIDTSLPIGNIVIPTGGGGRTRATTVATFMGNLDSESGVGDTVQRVIRVFDSLGTTQEVTVTFTRNAALLTWDWDASYGGIPTGDSGQVVFDVDGQVASGGTGTLNIPVTSGATTPFVFDLDMSGITQLADEDTIALTNQDGLPPGVLEAFSIGQGGIINGVFSNGLTEVLGQIALAVFNNPGGLVREGSNVFSSTPNSGIARVGLPSTGGRGSVNGGVLEGSNVDIATEFSNLIIAQRAFQAGARAITTADVLLNEAVNLVR